MADGRKAGLECDNNTYKESVIEQGFMDMLQQMKLERESFFRDVERATAEIDLDGWEQERPGFLEREILALDEKLAEVASSGRQGVASDVYDDMSLEIASEIDILQNELDQLSNKMHEAKMIKRNVEWFQNQLMSIHLFNPEIIIKRLDQEVIV